MIDFEGILTPLYGRQEAQAMARWIAEEPEGCYDADDVVRRLRDGEPLQYVFGHTDWYGLRLSVTPATLIPRPETAELVETVLKSAKGNVRVLDACTGSGCIAIKIKQQRPDWQVDACDISTEALEVAEKNAKSNNTEVRFFRCDILSEPLPEEYGIIVSNPPYVCESEKDGMERNVLRYEPASALFVPDADPLIFYRRISRLQKHVRLFFEINERFGLMTADMLRNEGYTDIEVRKDICGKDRILTARR